MDHGKKTKRALCLGEGPEYRPFCNFRSVPRRVCGRNRLKIAEGLYSGPFLKYSRAGIFPLFRNSDRPAGTFRGSKESSTAWLVPSTAEDPACWKQVSSSRQWSWKYEGQIQAVVFLTCPPQTGRGKIKAPFKHALQWHYKYQRVCAVGWAIMKDLLGQFIL